MATKKASANKGGEWSMRHLSLRDFLFGSSLVLNIGFGIIFGVMVWTNQADSTLIKEGLSRYCAVANDSKFEDSPEQVKGLRTFTCARGDAQQPFNDALSSYLQMKGISPQ